MEQIIDVPNRRNRAEVIHETPVYLSAVKENKENLTKRNFSFFLCLLVSLFFFFFIICLRSHARPKDISEKDHPVRRLGETERT